VLSKPSATDRENMMAGIDNSLRVLPEVLSGNLEKAMNWLHSQ
jgi:PTH1 family peptidyl-tRNA hydrolase